MKIIKTARQDKTTDQTKSIEHASNKEYKEMHQCAVQCVVHQESTQAKNVFSSVCHQFLARR